MTHSTETFPYTYRLYGLKVRSQIDLPELRKVEDESLVEGLDTVDLVLGDVPDSLEGGTVIKGWFEYSGDQCRFDFDDGGKYLADNGKRITVQRLEGVEDIDMRAYLFGSVFGTIVHQRGLLPLHVSAVLSPTGVIAFTGDSGAGKSTMASTVHDRTGWPIVCDDVAVLRPEDTDPILHCGILRLKLLEDAVEHLKKDKETMARDGENRFQKFHLIEPDMFIHDSVPLRALIQLNRGDECKLDRMGGAKSFECVTNAIYRPYLVMYFGDRDKTIMKSAQIANTIETYDLERPWSPEGLDASVELVRTSFEK